MHTLNMDFETYGAVDITKAGSYAYINGEGFLPLLLAWSIDGGEVQQFDFTQQGITQEWEEHWWSLLNNPDYQKIAWNVTFEREVFRSFFCIGSPIEQWSDTMVWSRYAGYPGGLDAASKALGLPEDKAKMAEGKKLIQFFCKPFKGLRRDPSKYPERWDLFKQYNRRDVEAEMEIRKIIGSRVDFPRREQTMWEIDQKINDQGILIDEQMCRNAVAMANRQKAKLIEEAVAITKLDNPNSVQQLKDWLGLDDEQTLRKKDVAEMLGTVTDDQQKRVLQIRQELGKSSVKKYEAMLRCACPDGRARGTLQFYGAGRTGRWCLTGDHEVLTPDGWIRIDEWNGGRIACWNPQGSILSFQKSDQVCFDYEGPMYDYEDTRISQISTPDHKMYYKPRYTADFVVGTVEEMAKHRPYIPLTGRRVTSPTLGRDELRVLVMVQADGHYTQDGILRLRFARKRKIERCKHLLRKCEIMFTYTPYTDGTATFSIPLRAQPIWLRMFRKKVFDWWMINEDPDVFFEELPLWDGCWVGPNSQQYSTTKKQNADIVQALAHLSGRTAVIVSKNHNMTNWSPQYVVNIWEKPGAAHEVKAKPVISEFSGKVYCASTPTGFFLVRRNGRVWITGNSGRGLQPQNYPQNHIGDGSMRDLEYARKLVKEGDDDGIELLFGSVNDTLSQLTRTALIPSPGNRFVVADFNAIEARVIAWLADEKWRIKTFADGKDIYCASASQMFHVPVEKHGVNGHLRQKGKIAELALGYGGGVGALTAMGALDMGLTEEELPDIVSMWREASPKIVRLWYTLGDAVMKVTKGEDNFINIPRLGQVYMSTPEALSIKLPSGRYLYYIEPKIGLNKFGGESFTYMGLNLGKWTRLESFGGKIVENCIQSIARDCLCTIIHRVAKRLNLYPVTHIHDEIVLEAPEAETEETLQKVLAIMAEPISWAPGLTLKGAGYIGNFYFKD